MDRLDDMFERDIELEKKWLIYDKKNMEGKQKELEELKKRDEKSIGRYEQHLVHQIYGATVLKDAYVGYYEERIKKLTN